MRCVVDQNQVSSPVGGVGTVAVQGEEAGSSAEESKRQLIDGIRWRVRVGSRGGMFPLVMGRGRRCDRTGHAHRGAATRPAGSSREPGIRPGLGIVRTHEGNRESSSTSLLTAQRLFTKLAIVQRRQGRHQDPVPFYTTPSPSQVLTSPHANWP